MKNVIDFKNNISLSEFYLLSQKDITDLFSINENLEIDITQTEKLKYITIPNFLRYPEDVKKYLIKFPSEDRMKTVLESKKVINKAPGFQQVYSNHFLFPLGEELHKIIRKNDFCFYDYDPGMWDYYTNCMYSGMKSYKRNYIPHIDAFAFAANIYLTDIEDTYTGFFKYVDTKTGKEFWHPGELSREDTIQQVKLTNEYNSELVGDWKVFRGDENYIEYLRIPSRYNCVSMYRGKFWHTVQFDETIPNRIRYSVVAVLK
jgi:hypothetical protein